MDDVPYLKRNHRKEEAKVELSAESRSALKEWLWADYLLYDHFKAKLQEKMDEFGELEMAISLSRLRRLNQQLRESCVIRETDRENLQGHFQDNSPVVLGYQVNEDQELCSLAAYTERAFINKLKVAQLGKVKNYAEADDEDTDNDGEY